MPLVVAVAISGAARVTSDPVSGSDAGRSMPATESPGGAAVAAVSRDSAWVVTGAPAAIYSWDGKTWKQDRVPRSLGLETFLNGVAATSPRNAWAVGTDDTAQGQDSVILHWNGSRWQQVSSPKPTQSLLHGVAAVSRSDAWAVGNQFGSNAIIEHWNGKTWKLLQIRSPDDANDLMAVTALSAEYAWAVGGGGALRWNGQVWK